MLRHQLLAGVALVGALALPAMAQTQQPAAAMPVDQQGDIIVYGKGETRQVQTLTAADISAAAPGTSALKVLEKLPSV